MAHERTDRALPTVAALLRMPDVVVRHEVLTELHAAGFADILPAHLGVLQHPGPDGQRPGVLAARALASKQAMNHLLHQLESGGYLTREPHAADRRVHVVRLTDRGWAASAVISEATARLDAQWRAALGDDVITTLAQALAELHHVIDRQRPSDT
jgi:DNA-binding MarR family transcriptional regulator